MDVYSMIKRGIPVSGTVLKKEIDSMSTNIPNGAFLSEHSHELVLLLRTAFMTLPDEMDVNDNYTLLNAVFDFISKWHKQYGVGNFNYAIAAALEPFFTRKQYPRELVLDIYRKRLCLRDDYLLHQKSLDWDDVVKIISEGVKAESTASVNDSKRSFTYTLVNSEEQKQRLLDECHNRLLDYGFVMDYLDIPTLINCDATRPFVDISKCITIYEDSLQDADKAPSSYSWMLFSAMMGFPNLPYEFVRKHYKDIVGRQCNFTFSTTHIIDEEFFKSVPTPRFYCLGHYNRVSILFSDLETTAKNFTFEPYPYNEFQRVEYAAQMKHKTEWLKPKIRNSETMQIKENFICSIILNALYDNASVDDRIEENAEEFFSLPKNTLLSILRFDCFSHSFLVKHLSDFSRHKLKKEVCEKIAALEKCSD